ncbi:MAG: Crp/Fnr family transcriptional regulator [Dehalococcoidales bacterium]|jgi:CRP-like cAMP-binding protein|nr:Crp/Fnr family transcriptional regulator [Dehalococcoidales bacterium]MDD3264755.1 Crp/Fnr family transcriptional regulator [Dehalococcoidales bacterium]MDD4322502.1 Crp/Fnr family transcriptional regulator [Dehalococcoidales bacterium]MDD4793871.1 Crp/Fnr family transcriptional regulator [Dehalococcoidales bacterium]MDD5122362.1 Crp/Fnr family transcriptional regulator [Dehalococcoidales bacterium]
MYAKWLGTLKASPIFKDIEEQNLSTMLGCLKPVKREYQNREIIALDGAEFSGIGVVADGKIALTRETFGGNRVILQVLGPGDIVGEMVAFSNLKKWPFTVIAQDDCCLFFLPTHKVMGYCSNICSSHSTLIMNVLNILSNKAISLSKTIEHLSARSIRGRVSSYLLDKYRLKGEKNFTLDMKRNELSDYLGIPRPSLSREMANMKQDGIIDYKGASITIKDLIRLEDAIE